MCLYINMLLCPMFICICFFVFFFFKQKTAYEMRISDWSSDVCSSDLERGNIDPRERFMSQPTILDGDADILLLCDHASNVVPEGITLGIAPALLDLHIAIDIGAEPLPRDLAERLDAPAILPTVSPPGIHLHPHQSGNAPGREEWWK